jgi:Rad3-related DNA helicase
VVISTNTINLQDQLINKDIPDLSAALGFNLGASILKVAPITCARAAWNTCAGVAHQT